MSDTVGHEPGLMAQTAKALEPLLDEQSANSQQTSAPGTPQNFTAFDWNDFELRYAEALGDADGNEQELLKQFEMLVKVSHAMLYSVLLTYYLRPCPTLSLA